MSVKIDRAHGAVAEGASQKRLVVLEDALALTILKIRAIGTLIGAMDPSASVSGEELSGVAHLIDLIATQGRLSLDARCQGGGE